MVVYEAKAKYRSTVDRNWGKKINASGNSFGSIWSRKIIRSRGFGGYEFLLHRQSSSGNA